MSKVEETDGSSLILHDQKATVVIQKVKPFWAQETSSSIEHRLLQIEISIRKFVDAAPVVVGNETKSASEAGRDSSWSSKAMGLPDVEGTGIRR